MIKFNLNGKDVSVDADPLKSLVRVLREDLELTGTKIGCAEGECGACTVLFEGKPVTSCTMNLIHAEGKDVKTVEWVAASKLGEVIKKAFYEENAVQCGFCFPGFMVTTYHYISSGGTDDRESIKRALSGNVCRCTGYEKIISAVQRACNDAKGVK